MELSKVIHNFTSKHTANLHERHAASIMKMCGHYSAGFKYFELAEVAEVIDLTLASIDAGHDVLVEPLDTLLQLCSKPFTKERMSDENIHVPMLPKFLNSVCPLLRLTSPTPDQEILILSACKLIGTFAAEGVMEIREKEASLEDKAIFGHDSSPLSRMYKNGTRNLLAIASSDVIDGLVACLAENLKKPDELVCAIINAIANSSLYFPNAEKFALLGGLSDLVQVLCRADDFRSYLVRISIEAIWNVLEVGGTNAVETMATEEIVSSLKSQFVEIVQKGYKLEDKCLRNELCILLNYIVNCDKSHPFFLTKDSTEDDLCFLDYLLYYSTCDELKLSNNGAGEIDLKEEQKPMFGTTYEELEFKKLMWTCVLNIIEAEDPEGIELIIQCQFMAALLIYVDPAQSNLAVHRWQQPQLKEIQLHALSVITNILSLVPEHFQAQNGNNILIEFLSIYSDYDRRKSGLAALESASAYASFKVEIAEYGIFDILFDIIQNDKENPLDLREISFSIIANICNECRPNQKEFRRKGGVELLKENLSSNLTEAAGNINVFSLAVLDCLWKAVFQNKRSELLFLDIEGVNVLLDLLETCNSIHRRLILSSVCHLLQNQAACGYFVDWTSAKTMRNASQLLIELYREEEERYGVEYENGILQNVERPLVPLNVTKKSGLMDADSKGFHRLKTALKASEEVDHSSEAYLNKQMLTTIREFDLRATIYCIFNLTKFDCHKLEPEEKQKIEVIQQYPNFKQGEIWRDIKIELSTSNIQATTDDSNWMDTSIEEAAELTIDAIEKQVQIYKRSKKQKEDELDAFYNDIRLKFNISQNQTGVMSKTTSQVGMGIGI